MSSVTLAVKNLAFGTTGDTLKDVFSEYGQVLDAFIITDPNTGQPRGFGFVTYATVEEANAAIAGLDGQMLDGRKISVSFTRGGRGGYGDE